MSPHLIFLRLDHSLHVVKMLFSSATVHHDSLRIEFPKFLHVNVLRMLSGLPGCMTALLRMGTDPGKHTCLRRHHPATHQPALDGLLQLKAERAAEQLAVCVLSPTEPTVVMARADGRTHRPKVVFTLLHLTLRIINPNVLSGIYIWFYYIGPQRKKIQEN